ncbi:MAG: hypothetical protein JSW51_04570, partial [Gemmatimonadota bacterium]
MQTEAYAIYAALLMAAALVVFRVVVRHDYQVKGKLTLISSFLETAVFGTWAWFTYANSPSDWPSLHASTAVRIIGWPLFVG